MVDGSAAWALIQASNGAALVVVGSRGHGGFAGLLLGSASQALLRHADCPVAVVRCSDPRTPTVDYIHPAGPVVTVVVSTGGHVAEVERFAVTAVRTG